MAAFKLGLLVHLLNFVLLMTAFVFSLRMVSRTSSTLPWLLLTVAFALLAVSPLLDFYGHYSRDSETGIVELSDILTLFSAILMLPGVYLMRRIVAGRIKDQLKLHQQLDELQRFHKLAVGRELRMKELMQENKALHEQMSSPSTRKPS